MLSLYRRHKGGSEMAERVGDMLLVAGLVCGSIILLAFLATVLWWLYALCSSFIRRRHVPTPSRQRLAYERRERLDRLDDVILQSDVSSAQAASAKVRTAKARAKAEKGA